MAQKIFFIISASLLSMFTLVEAMCITQAKTALKQTIETDVSQLIRRHVELFRQDLRQLIIDEFAQGDPTIAKIKTNDEIKVEINKELELHILEKRSAILRLLHHLTLNNQSVDRIAVAKGMGLIAIPVLYFTFLARRRSNIILPIPFSLSALLVISGCITIRNGILHTHLLERKLADLNAMLSYIRNTELQQQLIAEMHIPQIRP